MFELLLTIYTFVSYLVVSAVVWCTFRDVRSNASYKRSSLQRIRVRGSMVAITVFAPISFAFIAIFLIAPKLQGE